jgi:protein-S-isoprenylcysteine O-methyltransferase Ste14
MTAEKKDVPAIIMLPPTLVLFHVVAGITLNWMLGGYYGRAWGWIGLILLIACFAMIAWAKKLFGVAGTPVPPNQPATAIVQDGPYKYTRNPMYLSFMLGYIGLSFLASAPFMTLLAVPLFFLLDRRVIVPEEQYLSAKFGEAYLDYKKQVRRWI